MLEGINESLWSTVQVDKSTDVKKHGNNACFRMIYFFQKDVHVLFIFLKTPPSTYLIECALVILFPDTQREIKIYNIVHEK